MMHPSSLVVLSLGLCAFGCTPDPAPSAKARAADTPDRQQQDALLQAWRSAQALGREHAAPILAFVLPPAGQPADPGMAAATRATEVAVGMLQTKDGASAPPMTTARDVFLRQLQLLRGVPDALCALPPGPSRAQTIFLLTVPVVATAETCGAEPGETIVLLSRAGERRQGFALDLLDRAHFAEVLEAVVCADEDLAARREAAPPTLTRDLAQLKVYAKTSDAHSRRAWQELYDRLGSQLPAIAPAMVERVDGRIVADGLLGLWELQRLPLGTEIRFDQQLELGMWGMSVLLKLSPT